MNLPETNITGFPPSTIDVTYSHLTSSTTASSSPKEDHLLAKFSNETYEDLTMYLTAEQKAHLSRQLEGLPDAENQTAAVKKAIDENHLQAEIFRQKDFALYALLALKQRHITGMAFTTSQLFYNTLHYHDNPAEVRVVKLFEGNAINPEAREMLTFTAGFGSGIDKNLFPNLLRRFAAFRDKLSTHTDLTPSQIARFFDILKHLPSLEQQYLVIPEPDPISPFEGSYEVRNTDYISQTLVESGFNVFLRMRGNDGKFYRIIPSKGMIQAYLFARSEQEAPLLVTRFSLAPIDDMHQMILEDKRPLCLDVAFLDPILYADGRKCRRKTNDVTIHELYHGISMLDVPRQYRKKFYAIAAILKKALKNTLQPNDDLNKVLEQIKDKVIDFEHIEYTIAKILSVPRDEILFWTTTKRCFDLVFISPTLHKRACAALAQELAQNANEYRSLYGLGASNLQAFLRDLSAVVPSTPLNEGFEQLRECLITELNHLVHNKSTEELIELTHNTHSYLLAERAAEELKKNPRLL